jgi:hypothetical protein
MSSRRGGLLSWFVEPYRQIKLGLMVLLSNLVFSVLIMGIVFYYLWDVYSTMVGYFDLTQAQDTEVMTKLGWPLTIVAGLIILFIITTILITVNYTYQIYGPLVSIHRFLDSVLEGTPVRPLNIRESDQLHDLAVKLNRLAEMVGTDNRRSSIAAIHRALDQLVQGQSAQPVEIREADQYADLVKKLNLLIEKVNQK